MFAATIDVERDWVSCPTVNLAGVQTFTKRQSSLISPCVMNSPVTACAPARSTGCSSARMPPAFRTPVQGFGGCGGLPSAIAVGQPQTVHRNAVMPARLPGTPDTG